jgi:predicted metal-dependent RNase
MSTILNELKSLPENYTLFVHHKKVPKFLFPELTERGYQWHINEIKEGDDIFTFPKLKIIRDSFESKEILNSPSPKIIIAGSGMSEGGRVMHHEINFLPDPNNTILLMGYQAVGTLGRKIQEGNKTVIIKDKTVPVRAKIEMISGYSSHRDSDGLDFPGTVRIISPTKAIASPTHSYFLGRLPFKKLDLIIVSCTTPKSTRAPTPASI